MNNIFEGDPKISIDENGSRLTFKGGQPVMDQGLENLVFISLFTTPNWAGNVLFDNADQRIGSDFEETANQSITLQSINDLRQAAEQALNNPAFGEVAVEITNPNGNQWRVLINIKPPGQDSQQLLLQRNGINWIAQNLNPAHRRV